jgi:hypothetical protein
MDVGTEIWPDGPTLTVMEVVNRVSVGEVLGRLGLYTLWNGQQSGLSPLHPTTATHRAVAPFWKSEKSGDAQ